MSRDYTEKDISETVNTKLVYEDYKYKAVHPPKMTSNMCNFCVAETAFCSRGFIERRMKEGLPACMNDPVAGAKKGKKYIYVLHRGTKRAISDIYPIGYRDLLNKKD